MPIITIQLTREGGGPGRDILGKPPEATFVVLKEVELENRGWGGLPMQQYRKQFAAGGGAA